MRATEDTFIDIEEEPQNNEKDPFIARGRDSPSPDQGPMDFIHNNKYGAMIMFLTRWGMRIFGWVMVTIAATLFTLLISFYFLAIVPLVSATSTVIYTIMAVIGAFLSFNMVFNYVMCIRTSPGAPGQEWLDQMEEKLDELKRSSSTSVPGKSFSKFCNRCKEAKPARAHHCHICDKCVLRMDHHCPWINNCVGYNNHKYFVLFLFYLWACAVHVGISLGLVMLDMIPFDAQIWFAWATWFTFVVVLAGSMTVTMSGFFGWHVYLILTNQTTIEFQFNKFKVLTQKRSGKVVLNEYDIGMKNNVEQIFGKHRWWILLFLPSLSKPPLNGCEYPTMSNLQDFNEFNKSNKVDNLV